MDLLIIKKVAKQGGAVAGNARKELEEKTGEQVVSNENYLLAPEKSKKKIKWFIFTNIYKWKSHPNISYLVRLVW